MSFAPNAFWIFIFKWLYISRVSRSEICFAYSSYVMCHNMSFGLMWAYLHPNNNNIRQNQTQHQVVSYNGSFNGFHHIHFSATIITTSEAIKLFVYRDDSSLCLFKFNDDPFKRLQLQQRLKPNEQNHNNIILDNPTTTYNRVIINEVVPNGKPFFFLRIVSFPFPFMMMVLKRECCLGYYCCCYYYIQRMFAFIWHILPCLIHISTETDSCYLQSCSIVFLATANLLLLQLLLEI